MKKKTLKKISAFDLTPGRIIARKYEIIEKLGHGWEGEVYKIRELSTNIERAAKLFYPQRNINGKAAKHYAQKLHKLRHCSMVIHYHNEELITYKTLPVKMLVSEYVEGELLHHYLMRAKGKRLHPFQALHLIYALSKGMEEIHLSNEYHGDLHSENVIVQNVGLNFELKLLDLMHWEGSKKENIRDDVIGLVQIFYEVLGGKKYYAQQPGAVKQICCGLKRSIILRKFNSAASLCRYIEKITWD